MSNVVWNTLTVCGKSNEMGKFDERLLKEGNEYRLLESFLPCPQELIDTPFSWLDIGYEAFFNPDPAGYARVLEEPRVKEHEIKTREHLMEFVKSEYPEFYEIGLKINNNLFKYGYRSWYSWCVANWGTKHEVFNTKVKLHCPTHLVLEFDSAWTPPDRGLDGIAALFPELEFYLTFAEPGYGFTGFANWKNGEISSYHIEPWNPDAEFEEEVNRL